MNFHSHVKYFIFLILIIGSSAAMAQPTISVVFTPNTIGPGSNSQMTYTITNVSASPVTALAFTNVLPMVPGPMTLADPANPQTSCDLGASGTLSAPDGGTTVTLSDAQIGGSQSCTVTVNVTASTPGAHTNPAVTLNSSAGSSMSLPIDLTVVTTLPGFSKSFSLSSVPVGTRNTLTFTIDNTQNASPIGSLDFTDNFPAGLVVASPANESTDCISAGAPNTILTAVPGSTQVILDAEGSVLFAGLEVLPIGEECTVTVDVMAVGTGSLDNITNELVADGISAGLASATLESTATQLAIQKEFINDPAAPGGTVILDLTVTNFDRLFSANSVAFTDDLNATLAGLSINSVIVNECGGMIAGSASFFDYQGGNLAPESSCLISLLLDVPAAATPGVYPNITSTVTGTVDGSPVVGNVASDDLFVEPTPIFTKEFIDDPVTGGDQVTLRFTITNTDPTNPLSGLEFTDDIGGSVLPRDGTYPGLAANSLVDGTGLAPDPLLDICGVGSVLTIPDPNDTLPPTFPAFPPDPTLLQFTGGSLAQAGQPGDSCSFDVVLDVPVGAATGAYPNTTSDLTSGGVTLTVPATDDLIIISAPNMIKEFTDDPVAPGGTVTLEFTLEHSAESTTDATDITFTDDLATVLAGLNASGLPLSDVCGTGSSLIGSAGDTLLTLSNGTLMPGESCTFSVGLGVPAGTTPGTYSNTTSEVSATVEGLSVTSTAATDNLNVSGLTLTKEFTDDPVIAGDSVSLEFTLTNIHPTDDTSSIFFTDSLSAALTGLAIDPASIPVNPCGVGSMISGTTFLIFTGGSLLSGESCTFSVTLDVPAAAADGSYSNVTSFVTATQGGVPISTDPAADSLEVNSNLLQLEKSFTDDPVAPGNSVTLEFTLTNLDSTRVASAIAFTDDLDATLTGLVATGLPFAACGGTVDAIPDSGTIDFSGGTLAASASCTFSVTLDVPGGATPGVYPNSTSQVTGEIGGFPVTGTAASDELDIVNVQVFSKSFDGPTTATGTTILTYTVTNPGPTAVTQLSFTDDLDAVIPGLIATSLPAVPCGMGSSISGISLLTFSGGELAPMGGTCSFDVEVLVPATATAGTFPSATSDLFDAGLKVADPATAGVVIEPPPTFAKVFAPDSVGVGQQVSTLTFTIDNSASALAATNLNFTDNLPGGVVVATPANASTTCTGGTITAVPGSGSITYTGMGSVAAGATCTVQVDTVAVAAGDHVNTTGDLTSSSGNSGTASDTLTANTQPGFSKSFAPNPSIVNTPVTLTFTIDNTASTVDATGVSFNDPFPAGLEVASPPNNSHSCSLGMAGVSAGDTSFSFGGTVSAGSSCTVQVDIVATATGDYANTTGDLTSSLGNSGTASDSLRINPPPAFSKAFGSAVMITNIPETLIFTIDNSGSTAAATALSFSDSLPAGMIVSNPANASTTCTGGNVTANIGSGSVSYLGGSIAAGATCTLTVDVVTTVPGAMDNTSEDLTSSLGNSGSASDSVTSVSPPGFTKTFNPSAIAVNGVSTLTFTFDNSANSLDATGMTFVDNLPAGVVVAPAANIMSDCVIFAVDPGTVPGASRIELLVGTVAASSVCTLTVDVTSSVLGDHLNTTGDLTSSHGNSGTASATLTVTDLPILSKAFGTNPDLANNVNTLTFTIDNTGGTVDVTGLSFNDPFPAGLSVATPANASTTCTGGTLTAADGSGNVNYAGGTVTAGVSCTISVDVIANVSGDLLNETTALSTDLGTSNIASATLTIEPPPLFSKSFAPDTIALNDQSTLTFTIDNSANTISATGLNFIDNFPNGIIYSLGSPVNNTCGGTADATNVFGASEVTLTGGSVAAGATCQIEVTVEGSLVGLHTNTSGDLTSSHGNSGPASAVLTVTGLPVFSKSFTNNPTGVNVATPLVFTIDNSSGVADISGLSFTDNMPAGLVVSPAPGVVNTCTGGTVTATPGSGTITYFGGTVTTATICTITVNVQSANSDTYNNVTGVLSTNLGDSNAASDDLLVTLMSGFSKSFAPSTIVQNAESTLTFVIDNSASGLDATSVEFTDNMPAEIAVAATPAVTSTCAAGSVTATPGTSVISFTAGTVVANSSCSISVNVTSSVVGAHVNETGDLTSSQGNSGTATDILTVDQGLTMTKVFNTSGPFLAGNDVEMILTIINNSSLEATNINFSDDLDAFVPGSTAVGLPMTDICGAGSEIAGTSVLGFFNGTLAANSSCQFSVMVSIPENTPPGQYINTTSALFASINGATVNGGAASEGSGVLFINGAAYLVPVWNQYGLLLTMMLMMMFAGFYFRKVKS